MNVLRDNIIKCLCQKTGQTDEFIRSLIEVQDNLNFGDYSFPCFKLAGIYKMTPNLVAQSIADNLVIDGVKHIEVIGSYINFFIDSSLLSRDIISEILIEDTKYGNSTVGNGQTIVIDFSSVNIAKPFHIGHLSTTAIGNSLYKIFSFLGYTCVGINHLGDWGTQFGKLIVAYQKWGNNKSGKEITVNWLVELYVKFHKEAELDESLNDLARTAFKNLENGEKSHVDLWELFRETSLVEFKKVYKILNISFDSWDGESFYNSKIDDVLNELQKNKLLLDSNGAKIVDLAPYGLLPCLIQRSDGASLYATRDIAAAFYRKNKYNPCKIIYVVGTTQELHFKQFFKVVDLLDHKLAQSLVHVNFGTIRLKGGAMSTRKGVVVHLSEILDESIKKVRKIIEERRPDLNNKEEISKKIGVGAVIFSALSAGRKNDSTFSWDKILNFESGSAPYIQYSFARISSIIKKSPKDLDIINFSTLTHPSETALIKQLALFPNVVKEAADKYEPAEISKYLLNLCKLFNRFYSECPVINHDNLSMQIARLRLCIAIKIVIHNGLMLLGIEAIEQM